MGSKETDIGVQKDGEPHYKAAKFLIKMSPVINREPYKMPPVPITSWKGDRRQWEVCIGGYLLHFSKGGRKGVGAGWRAANTGKNWLKSRKEKSELGNWGIGFKNWIVPLSKILEDRLRKALCIQNVREK